MTRLHVEGWAPEYGSSVDTDLALGDDGRVDEAVEVSGPWEPLPGRDDGVDRIGFVDGVRRVDARLTIDDPEGPVPGLCGSFGVGAVVWDRTEPRSDVVRQDVTRLAVFAAGKGMPMPPMAAGLHYRTESVADTDPGALVRHLHGAMRKAEGVLAEELARDGLFVVADGPINDLSATDKVGYVKSHRVPHLSPATQPIMRRLRPGERTPLFLLGAGGAYPRYSWYQRLAHVDGGHAWSGVVRAEVSSHLDVERAITIADRTAAVLPLVASQPHLDPRAPQNLVPIAALEQALRRRLGDAGIVYRTLRAAASGAAA